MIGTHQKNVQDALMIWLCE